MTGHVPRLSKVQAKAPVQRVARSQIREAFYNPRHITKHAAKKLEAKLRKRGLVSTLTWNKRTGNLVSGHQRLKLIDIIEGTPDYSLDVSVVDLSPKDEAELNLEMNNRGLQGQDDVAKLEAMVDEFDIDLLEVGFDQIDLEVMFEGQTSAVLDDVMHEEEEEPSSVADDMDELQTINDQKRETAKVQALKDRKKEYKGDADEADDHRTFSQIIYRTNEEREILLKHLELKVSDRYIDRAVLFTHLGLELPAAKPKPGKRKPAKTDEAAP